jgi:uncharacterized membrane protein
MSVGAGFMIAMAAASTDTTTPDLGHIVGTRSKSGR